MTVEKTLLGSIINIKKGSYITKKEANEGPYPVILGGQEPAYYIDKYNHTGRAIVISRSGASAGYVSRWNEPIFVTDGFLIEPKENVEFDFLYYLLKLHQPQLQGLQGGSAIPHVNPRTINAIEVICPSIEEQTVIAAILSAYDNLIENNQRQIRLLEEAAQRLYKEWFVDLRFPGYEDTPIVDGIPKGWTVRPIWDFGEVITGKTPSTAKKEYYGGAIPFVKIPDMHDCVYPIKTESTLTDAGAKTQINKFIPRNSIMVSCIATVGLVNLAVEKCQTNQQINSIVPVDEKDVYFLYSAMKRIKELLEGVGSNGATMTNVNKTKFANLPVLYPTEELRNLYYDFCNPVFAKIYCLSRNIVNLINARDRLLPKLMSGEMEV